MFPNRQNPHLTVERVFLPGAELGCTGKLRLGPGRWVSPMPTRCFCRGCAPQTVVAAGERGRAQVLVLVTEASERADGPRR